MKWILVIWIAFTPETTGTMLMTDEDSCLRVLDRWESISVKHEGLCVLGNYEELELEQINKRLK